jgi:uncharacterized repeat protein (TIGR01451 family)
LTITKTADNTSPMINNIVHFTMIVQNHGPDTAVDVNVLDKMPSGLHFESYTSSRGKYNPATGIWSIGNLPNGAVATITITTTVTGTESITNEAKVTSLTYDPTIDVATATINATSPKPAPAPGPAGPSAEAAQKTVPMQPTGMPLGILVVAVTMVLTGVLIPRRR